MQELHNDATPGTAYADASSAILDAAEDIGTYTALWAMHRDDSRPDADARRAANSAMDAIDRATRELYKLRERLVSDIRAADDAAAARVDAMLVTRRDQRAMALAMQMSRKGERA